MQPYPDDSGHFCSAEAAHAVIIMFSQLEVYRWPGNDRTAKQHWGQQSEQFATSARTDVSTSATSEGFLDLVVEY